MIDPNSEKSEKLKQARNFFESSVDHYSECNEERRQCARYHHNSQQKGQWPESVREQLASERRPYFTFNLMASKVLSFIGIQRDVRRSPKPEPHGVEDRFLSDVIGVLSGRVRKKAKAGRTDAAVLEDGAVRGEGDGQVYVDRDPRNPGWLKIDYKHLSPHQTHWDPNATERDRSDADFVAVDTWMSKSSFVRMYPDHAQHFEALRKGSLIGDMAVLDRELEYLLPNNDKDTYSRERCDKYYFDQKREMIRVVAMEYKHPKKQWFILNAETGLAKNLEDVDLLGDDGQPMPVSEKREFLEWRIEVGDMAGYEIVSSYIDEVYWLHFVGSEILFDGKSMQPFDGFTVVPYVFFLDDEENEPYGLTRNLIDPQTQFNKSYCLSIELSANQAKPGTIVEESAVDDVDVFAEQLRTIGSVAVVKDGAISNSRYETRPVPTASSASQVRVENDLKMLHEVSGIFPENENIHQAEAALTHQLRNHKSRLIHADPIESFEDYQIEMERRIVQTIIRAMPGPQIAYLLGNDERYQVERTEEGAVVYEMKPNPEDPQGQPQIVGQAPLTKFRALEADIELQASGENTSAQAIELGFLIQLAGAGIPIHPDLMIDRGIQNRADRELAKQHAESVSQAQSAAAQENSKRLDMEIMTALETERGKADEEARHNVAQEILKALKQDQDAFGKLLELWERADEAEKSFIVEKIKATHQNAGSSAGGSVT